MHNDKDDLTVTGGGRTLKTQTGNGTQVQHIRVRLEVINRHGHKR